ncbi:MAG: ABC transporter substrate-binding protein, partial [Bacteroidota bacterium]
PEKLLIQAPRLQDFAAQFDKASVEREPGRIVGSGPYQLAKWLAGQRIQLEKKQSWWGDRLVDTVPVLAAIPLRLTYELLSKEAGLNGLLLSEEIDALGSIPPAIFNDLAENEQVRKNYSLHQPMQLTYYYIGLYNKSPKLSDRRVRRALAHLVDVPRVIDQLLYGSGQATIGPIHPSKPYYHRELSPIAFDPERAATLLVEAGWEDRNGDGRLDREVDGQAVELSLSYKFPQGNRVGESLGLLLQEQARKVGIDITLEAVNFGQLIREYGRRDFELVYLRLSKPPGLEDLKQSWHRSSDTPSGSNRVGFGTPESDELIDKIRQEFDREKRNDLYRQIQEIIYEEQACIFLYCPRERIALHQSLNAKVSLLAPGYFPQYFETVGHNNLNVPSYNSTK